MWHIMKFSDYAWFSQSNRILVEIYSPVYYIFTFAVKTCH